MAPLQFAGDPVTLETKTPEALCVSAEGWLNLAGEDLINAADALVCRDRSTVLEALKAPQSKVSLAISDVTEAVALDVAAGRTPL